MKEPSNSLGPLTSQQANSLKHQPETGLGLRDQVLLCLLLNEKLPVKTMCELRVAAFDSVAKVLILPPNGEEEMQLSEETFRVLHQYCTQTTPSVFLLQASGSNGELSGGGITPGAVYARVEYLGTQLRLTEKLTVDACYAYRDSAFPIHVPRKRVQLHTSEKLPSQSDPSMVFPSPITSLEALMSGLANLDERVGMLLRTQHTGNITPRLESECQHIDALCASLHKELALLRQIVEILPLHFMLLRLFPQREENISEPFLIKLEMCITETLLRSFQADHSRNSSEEEAYRKSVEWATLVLGEEQRESLDDLLKGIVLYASMSVQRKMQVN